MMMKMTTISYRDTRCQSKIKPEVLIAIITIIITVEAITIDNVNLFIN